MEGFNHFFVHIEHALFLGDSLLDPMIGEHCKLSEGNRAAVKIIPVNRAQDFLRQNQRKFFRLRIGFRFLRSYASDIPFAE